MLKPPLKRFPQFYSGRKAILSIDELEYLFNHRFIVEEKLDGTLKIEVIDELFFMFEDMKYVHSVFYNSLPARYILVDVCNKDGERLFLSERYDIAKSYGYKMPPILYISNNRKEYDINDTLNWLTKSNSISHLSEEPREGFVIKSQENRKLGGKWSRLDLNEIDRYDKSRLNRIIG